MPKRLHLSGDADWTAEVDNHRVTLAGSNEALTVPRGEGGRFVVETALGPTDCIAVVRGDVVWVGIAGHVFEFQARQGARRLSTRDEDALSPPMSATVVRILAKVGDRVSTGEVLIALEAMKMELSIRAPRDGVVSAVHCQEGDMVQPGTVLVTL